MPSTIDVRSFGSIRFQSSSNQRFTASSWASLSGSAYARSRISRASGEPRGSEGFAQFWCGRREVQVLLLVVRETEFATAAARSP